MALAVVLYDLMATYGEQSNKAMERVDFEEAMALVGSVVKSLEVNTPGESEGTTSLIPWW